MPQFHKDPHRLTVCRLRGTVFSFCTIDGTQIRQRAGAAPEIARFPKGGERLLVQLPGSDQVASFARNVALLIDGPSGTAAITEFLEDLSCFAESPERARILAASFNDIGEVMQATSGSRAVWQEAPTCQATLEMFL